MPREKKYASDAERQAAYRERKKAAQFKAQEGYSDRELGRAVRDLFVTMQYEASQGNALAALLLRETPAATLDAIGASLVFREKCTLRSRLPDPTCSLLRFCPSLHRIWGCAASL